MYWDGSSSKTPSSSLNLEIKISLLMDHTNGHEFAIDYLS